MARSHLRLTPGFKPESLLSVSDATDGLGREGPYPLEDLPARVQTICAGAVRDGRCLRFRQAETRRREGDARLQ